MHNAFSLRHPSTKKQRGFSVSAKHGSCPDLQKAENLQLDNKGRPQSATLNTNKSNKKILVQAIAKSFGILQAYGEYDNFMKVSKRFLKEKGILSAVKAQGGQQKKRRRRCIPSQ